MKNRQTSNGVIVGNGINGSLRKRETMQPQQHTEYYMFNSQGNLKAYSDDIMDFAYYGYNAANTRTYKLSLYNTNIWINGQQEPLNMQLQQAMFYPNTYLNFNGNGEYTKHYYNGTERIASRLGDNTTTIAINNNILEDRKLQLEEQFREDIHKLIEETVPIDLPPFMDVNALQPTGTPNDIYYYHPNHLGSTSFVTDQNQTITQGFLYAPYGEITTEYNINFGNNTIPKYSFNAKELDEETGMYYYEARYYAPPTFISRDPLMNEKPWLTPYHYCSNNPIGRVDPTGMFDDDTWVKTGDGKFVYNSAVNNNADAVEIYGNGAKSLAYGTQCRTNKGNLCILDRGGFYVNGEFHKVKDEAPFKTKVSNTVKKILYYEGGHADPANTGRVTQQDVKVGLGVVGIVSGGLVLVTGSVVSGTATVLLGINDAGSNSNAESILQQNISNPTAKTMVGHGETIASFAFGGWGIKTIIKNPQKIEEGISATVGVSTGIFGTTQLSNQKVEKTKEIKND